MNQPTPFEQILALLAQLNESEKGRLRHILIQPGHHRPISDDDRKRIGTNAIQGTRGER